MKFQTNAFSRTKTFYFLIILFISVCMGLSFVSTVYAQKLEELGTGKSDESEVDTSIYRPAANVSGLNVPKVSPRGYNNDSEKPPTFENQTTLSLLMERWRFIVGYALLVLLFSSIFGTINFYHGVVQKGSTRKGTFRYLLLWIAANFTISLIVLFFIIKMSNIKMSNKEISLSAMLFYSIVVTALPELLTNVQISIGKEVVKLNLVEYKQKVVEIIQKKLEAIGREEERRFYHDMRLYFSGHPRSLDDLKARAREFCVERLYKTGAGKTDEVCAGIEKADSVNLVLSVLRQSVEDFAEVKDYFMSEVTKFRQSLVYVLLETFYPQISINEAYGFINNNIHSLAGLISKCFFRKKRNAVAEKLGMEFERINNLYLTAIMTFQLRFRKVARNFAYGTVFFAVIAPLVTLTVTGHGDSGNYTPNPAYAGEPAVPYTPLPGIGDGGSPGHQEDTTSKKTEGGD